MCGTEILPQQHAKWTKDGFEIVACPSCGLLFRQSMPSDHELLEIYAEDYFRRVDPTQGAQGYMDYVEDEEIHRLAARRRLDWIARDLPVGRLLDVGCAAGFFLDEARTRGWTVRGIDVAAPMTAVARDRLGLEVETARFAEFPDTQGPFDLLTMWDYIEHSADPARDMARAHTLLRAEGRLCLSTGDAGTPVARLSGRRWHLLTPRHHNFFFTKHHLRAMLQQQGFEVVEMRYEPRYATIAYLVFKLGTVLPGGRALARPAEWLRGRRIGGVQLAVNMFDIVTVVARRPGSSNDR